MNGTVHQCYMSVGVTSHKGLLPRLRKQLSMFSPGCGGACGNLRKIPSDVTWLSQLRLGKSNTLESL